MDRRESKRWDWSSQAIPTTVQEMGKGRKVIRTYEICNWPIVRGI